jgi:hypothetical protein
MGDDLPVIANEPGCIAGEVLNGHGQIAGS